MKILVDILHPAHVHFFRNAIDVFRKKGDEVIIVARDKECVTELLDGYGLAYTLISTQKRGLFGLVTEMVSRSWKLFLIARKFKPDFMIGIMGPSIAVVGKFLKSKTIIFYDTEMAGITNWFAYPLADMVCTPACYTDTVRGTHRTYAGYHELAYLHPDRFTPDPAIPAKLGVLPQEPYFVVRFVSWDASHDLAEHGISLENKYRIVRLLERYGRVFISSEGTLPEDLQHYVPALPADKMHHLLAFAGLFIGESATMASECSVLGVQSVYIAKTSRGYIDEQRDRYDLVHIFTHEQQDAAIETLQTLLDDTQTADAGRKAGDRLLADMIDVTGWLTEYLAQEYRTHRR